MMFFLFLIFVFSCAFWAYRVEPRAYEINRHDVTIRKKIPQPLRVLHLSDTHFAYPNPWQARFFERLAQDEYDLIMLSGDIIDCEAGVHSAVESLKKLRAQYGFFAVFGNHDYYDYRLKDFFLHNFPGQPKPERLNPAEVLKQALESAGIAVLVNETREIRVRDTPILVHGLDDPTTGRANIRETLSNFDPRKINLLLTHTVDAFLDIGEGEIDVSFSGHSHGGQVRLPFFGPLLTHTIMGRAYASGILQVKGAVCSISRGIGFGRVVPMRFLCPPEAIVLNVYGI